MTLLDLDAVTVAGYRLRTGDETSLASAVTGALVEAESLLSEELRRLLPSEERTAEFQLYPDGRVYPNAWPITTADAFVIDGRALIGGSPVSETGPIVVGVRSATLRAEVTWTGGFTAETLPVTLAQAIYDLARADLADTPSIPAGTSATVGDVSVSGTPAGGNALDSAVPGLWARVGRYADRWIA